MDRLVPTAAEKSPAAREVVTVRAPALAES